MATICFPYGLFLHLQVCLPFSLLPFSQIFPAFSVSTFVHSVSLLSTFIFFSTIHFILKHPSLNVLFLVLWLLLILNVKESKIQNCTQHMRKNIQCLFFCIYVTSLNIIFPLLSIYLHISSLSMHTFFTEYSPDYIIPYHFNF